MPRMYCQSCGRDMGNHKFHDKGICKHCRKKLGLSEYEKIEKWVKNNITIDEQSRTWKVIG